jgi:pseudouridylate synthase / pseudouridine kinase
MSDELLIGDSLVGSLLASFVQDQHVFESPKTMLEAMTDAQRAAVLSLQSGMAISPMISSMPRSFKRIE